MGVYLWKTENRQTNIYDFVTDWDLWWVGASIGYGTPTYASSWWYIWTSNTSSYQWNIVPPSTIYNWTLKSIKIYFTRPQSTTSTRGSAVGITTADGTTWIEYGRNHASTWWWLNVRYSSTDHWMSVQEIYWVATSWSWVIVLDAILENNWHITVNLSRDDAWYTYDAGECASYFQSCWSDGSLQFEIARWNSNTNYIKKVEITTLP